MLKYLIGVGIFFILYKGIDWFTRTFFGFGLDSEPLTKEEWDKEQVLRVQASKNQSERERAQRVQISTEIVDSPK